MAEIPDAITSKPRKFLNHAFGYASVFVIIVGILNSLSGKPFVAHLVLGFVLAYIADRIKYRWTLRRGGGVYE